MRGGLSLKRMVLIGAPASLSDYMRSFARLLGISSEVRERLRLGIERRYGSKLDELDRIEDLCRLETPPCCSTTGKTGRCHLYIRSASPAIFGDRSSCARTDWATTGFFAMRRSLRRRPDSSPTPARDSRVHSGLRCPPLMWHMRSPQAG